MNELKVKLQKSEQEKKRQDIKIEELEEELLEYKRKIEEFENEAEKMKSMGGGDFDDYKVERSGSTKEVNKVSVEI